MVSYLFEDDLACSLGESESENILPRMDYVLESIGKDPSFWTTSRTQQTASGEEHGRGAVRGDLKPRVAVVERYETLTVSRFSKLILYPFSVGESVKQARSQTLLRRRIL